MAKNKLQWPVAQIREDGTPAVWLTHTNWMILRNPLLREYCNRREIAGKREARVELKRPDITDVWDFATPGADAALGMYRAGYDAWHHVAERTGMPETSPQELKAIGDEWQARGHEEEMKRLQASAQPQLAAA